MVRLLAPGVLLLVLFAATAVAGESPPPGAAPAATIPVEEPAPTEEGFFERAARRARVAFPGGARDRALLAALAWILLLALVALGARMANLPRLSLGRTAGLAGLLAAILCLDLVFADPLLRADLALATVPLQFLVWVTAAAAVTRAGFAKSFTLLGSVLFSAALVGFASAAVLVLA